MSTFDVIILGSDVNGLVSAIKLANRGKKVVVVDRHDIGGSVRPLTVSEGHEVSSLLHDTSIFRPSIVKELQLESVGLKYAESSGVFLPERPGYGSGLFIADALGEAESEIREYAPNELPAYKRYCDFIERIRPVVGQVVEQSPIDLNDLGLRGIVKLGRHAYGLRRLGRSDMLDLMRLAPMCVADLLNEFFGDDRLKAGLALPALYGSWCGPRSPYTAANLLVYGALKHRSIEGGALGLRSALIAAARKAQVELCANAAVREIQIEAAAATGVLLADGKAIKAPLLASAMDPKTTFLSLIAPQHLPGSFEQSLINYRTRGITAILHLALSEPLEFPCRPGLHPERARLLDDLNQIEKAFDPVKYKSFTKRPVLEVFASPISTTNQQTISVAIHFAPYELKGGWHEAARHDLEQAVLDVFSEFVPQIRDLIRESVLLTPDLIERDFGIWGGHLYHGEQAPDQLLVRPALQASNYATPITNLFLCGSGSYPGGGLSGLPGALSAQAMLGQ